MMTCQWWRTSDARHARETMVGQKLAISFSRNSAMLECRFLDQCWIGDGWIYDRSGCGSSDSTMDLVLHILRGQDIFHLAWTAIYY